MGVSRWVVIFGIFLSINFGECYRDQFSDVDERGLLEEFGIMVPTVNNPRGAHTFELAISELKKDESDTAERDEEKIFPHDVGKSASRDVAEPKVGQLIWHLVTIKPQRVGQGIWKVATSKLSKTQSHKYRDDKTFIPLQGHHFAATSRNPFYITLKSYSNDEDKNSNKIEVIDYFKDRSLSTPLTSGHSFFKMRRQTGSAEIKDSALRKHTNKEETQSDKYLREVSPNLPKNHMNPVKESDVVDMTDLRKSDVVRDVLNVPGIIKDESFIGDYNTETQPYASFEDTNTDSFENHNAMPENDSNEMDGIDIQEDGNNIVREDFTVPGVIERESVNGDYNVETAKDVQDEDIHKQEMAFKAPESIFMRASADPKIFTQVTPQTKGRSVTGRPRFTFKRELVEEAKQKLLSYKQPQREASVKGKMFNYDTYSKLSTLPRYDDFGAPVKWVTFSSNMTLDGLAKVTNPEDLYNRQYLINGAIYIPVIDKSRKKTTKVKLAVNGDPPISRDAIKTLLRNVDVNKTTEQDWLTLETVMVSVSRSSADDKCTEKNCQARCQKMNCESLCEGDNCSSGCVGVSCTSYCKGIGCMSMCIGEYCSTKCDGENCDSRCWGKSCKAKCISDGTCYHTSNEVLMDESLPTNLLRNDPQVLPKPSAHATRRDDGYIGKYLYI